MSLRSGRNYLKDYAAEELDGAAGGEQQPDVATQPATMQQRSQPFDTKSQQSRTSTRRSQRTSSSTASAAARAYAKAQAARAQLAFAEKEANAMKQRAGLDAHLHVLQCQKAIAAAEAEASAYEEAEIQSGELYGELCEEVEPISAVHRTNEYVQQQCELLYSDTQHDPAQLPKGNDNEVDVQDSTQITNPFITNSQAKSPPVNRERKQEQTHTPNLNNCLPEASETQQFAKYLIRKELVSTGLLQFDDKPENYWAWKTSFISATKDLNLSPREELDLLTKWLGPTSSEQAKRIRAVHILNPAAGAKMVWQRLEECYGSPEAIEDALLKKVEDFPKLTNKDNVKLQELSDILLELQCAKQDGALPGLAYLDTARGVRQIVDKLPFNLQERWTTVGTEYKETHSVSFPPFSVFTQFVQRQAKMRNDPSFAMSKANTHVPSPTEKLRSYSRKPTVSAHKMDITAEPDQNNLSPKKMEEPDRQCPIHKKPHPLKKCKLFRDKPIEERQAYLKEHHICYRCCGSVQHIAKNCKAVVKCIECDSLKHLSAMHPGPTPAPKSTTPGNNDNEEQTESSPSVESKCTEVCGQSDSPRSCSKVSLVKVYPAGQKERAIKMYAVIDDQSNRSLVKSEFFSLFNINARPTPYTLKTCSGREQTSGRRAVNFFLESLDGEVNIQLPPLIECDSVPDNRSEIPSPEIAQHHPHLLPVANNIPPVDHHAPILLLLGRDVIRVHKVREQINGPNNAPYAQKLDLGWVIVGEVCLGKAHSQSEVNVYKTHTLDNGRASYFEPCPNTIHVKENYGVTMNATCVTDDLGHSVFVRSESDNKQAMSIDDKAFLTIMDNEVYQNQENSWVAPLPFRSLRRRLPDNREQALKRLCSLRKTLEKKPETKDYYIQQRMLDNNQADQATRFIPAAHLQNSTWFSGPPILYSDTHTEPHTGPFTLIEPEKDREIRPEIKVMKTTVAEPQLRSERFKKYSNWTTLCRVIARLIHVVTSFAQKTSGQRGWKSFSETPNVQELTRAKVVIIRAVQQEAYKGTLENIKEGKKASGIFDALKKLNPVVDKDSLLRVGGRLSTADLTENEKHPLIIPSTSHIAILLVTHYHEQVAHQGRHITEGAIRGAGYWIIGGKRLVSSVIHKCVTCRKLRGKMQIQKMADLPADRVTPEPPFTTVGLDVFGPWTIVTRRTRGGCSQNKRWAVLFTCMSTRAVHIELIETMSADSFINALRRLFSIRGPAKFLRSDRGTNFVGACKELGLNSGNKAVGKYLQGKGCVWTFNPPHASHMGGSWERLIGVARRIPDAMLLRTEQTRLTHEVLCTFMAEVMAIINARPLVPISTDPDSPAVLTPAMLLTQKMSAKHVQHLADTFWKRWKGEYLSTLQSRAKWTETRPNVKEGDVVLLKDSQASRNEWPMALIVKTFPSSDKKVRKVEVRTVKDGTVKMFLRPVSEIVVLLAETE
ncbi:sorting nexin-4 [Sarotherodon galilaeus]